MGSAQGRDTPCPAVVDGQRDAHSLQPAGDFPPRARPGEPGVEFNRSRVAARYWHDQATADWTHVSAGAGRGLRIVAAFVPHPASASPRRMTIIAMAAMWGVSNGMPGRSGPYHPVVRGLVRRTLDLIDQKELRPVLV